MLTKNEQKLLVEWYDLKMQQYDEIEKLLNKEVPEKFRPDRALVCATQQELMGLGLFDKQRIGKAISNLEMHGLVDRIPFRQAYIEGRHEPMMRMYGMKEKKMVKDMNQHYEKEIKRLTKSNPTLAARYKKLLPIEKSKMWVYPHEFFIIMTRDGRDFTRILKKGNQGIAP